MLFSSLNKKFYRESRDADNYDSWRQAAQRYDQQSGMLRWRKTDRTRRYDYVSIRQRLDHLRALRAHGDNQSLLFALNEGIHGNMGGMGNPRLYGKSKFGTKLLITEYVEEINDSLLHLASDAVSDINRSEKLDFFRRVSHCFGRSALMLSGAGTLGFFHNGVVSALMKESLLPDVLSGASAGALICALVGTHPEEDVYERITSEALYSELIAILSSGRRPLRSILLSAERVKELIETIIPDLTFQEAFEVSGKHINISVAPAEAHQTSRLLNAFSSPNVCVREAVMASTAIPGLFPPVTLVAKNEAGNKRPYLPMRKWVDGSVSDDLPASKLSRLYGCNHYIASQTNPLVLPFVRDVQPDQGVLNLFLRMGQNLSKEFMETGIKVAHRVVHKSPKLSGITHLFHSVVAQQYTGDVNLLPSVQYANPLMALYLKSEEEILHLMDDGRRSVWPKLEMIRVQTRISRTLDKILCDYDEDVYNHLNKHHEHQQKVRVNK